MADVAETMAPEAEAGSKRKDVKATATTASAPAAVSVKSAGRKKPKPALLVVGAILLGAGLWYGYGWLTDGRFFVSTDDAYVSGDIAVIAPKIAGYVAKVDAVENQPVKAGDPLVTLDDGDYKLAVQQAEAAIATQTIAINAIDAQIGGAKAALAQANAQKLALEAALRGADITRKRTEALQEKDVGTVASRDDAKIAYDRAEANLAAGRAAITAAGANIAILEVQRKQAESTLAALNINHEKAQRDLSFTVLRAPFDGVAGNFAVQAGDFVSAGKRLAALVPSDALYIDANFKETQIAKIVPGAVARVHVDAFEDHAFEGKVLSISPASGSVFSMLPAENATGNFTKVVQRLPVRIAVPKDVLEKGWLRPGLSTVVSVDTRAAE